MKLNRTDLLKRGVYVNRMTPKSLLDDLLIKLRPQTTEHQLIRVGAEFDGGYLVPNDLEGIAVCYSPGVDVNASFEKQLLDEFNINSHLADASVDGPPDHFTPQSFTKKFLGAVNTPSLITLDAWLNINNEFAHTRDLLLQMDIEGGEYESILACSESALSRFRVMVLEIHGTENWGDPGFFNIVQTFFNKLLTDFYVCHIHPNNCCGLTYLYNLPFPRVFEMTFIRKDRVKHTEPCSIFPHALDRPNLADRPDLILPREWFGPSS